ncbi:NAD-dependent protein deacetylase SIR4 [Batrachochytrium salamandrivorans]|nr:NAD-dependent protein deacetylase SIR4 [Batrachochytrium salamandrivorans]KAH9266919.1 NAD-dependent protein deacetylase SIR4 [Batrachochytrium salamandrivorans]KAJ1341334.1 NAD-dependent protein deacetylase SIR4 [Batrachochytrium salamandrivorans]
MGGVRDNAYKLSEFLVRSQGKTMVLTGAGVSTDSGIPDYRGPQGIYSRNRDFKPIQYQQFIGPHSFRQRYWSRSFMGWPQVSQALPNPSHHAIAALESALHIAGCITQNVDGLHRQAAVAANPNHIEIHGSLHLVNCIACGHQTRRQAMQDQLAMMNPMMLEWQRLHPSNSTGDVSSTMNPDGDAEMAWDHSQFQYPHCPKCSGILKPNVVFFGENMPSSVRDTSFKMVDEASSLLVVGSSLQVYSALRLVKRASDAGMAIAILNMGSTRGDDLAQLKIDQKSSDVLEELLSIIK